MSPLAKVTLFAISAVFMTLVGAIMAPRWTYIEPSIAFNPTISFQVVIMALLGGAHRLWGPARRRHSADAAVRVPVGAVSQHLDADHRRRVPADRLCAARRAWSACGSDVSRNGGHSAGRAQGPGMTPPHPQRPCLRSSALTRAFGGLVAVNALDLTVQPGEIVGLLGPNGSGKTTALNLISGVLRPDSGAIRFAGQAIEGMPAHRIARLGLGTDVSAGPRPRRHELRRERQGRPCLP